MRCTACQYPLWNIRPPAPGANAARHCPECGAPFKPSDFEFVLNSVRFCCPHCNQEYYGTGDKGHLVPPEFDCVKCAKRISMDEMVLAPTEGVSEQQTQVELNPWLGRKRWRTSAAWFKTIWMSLFSPVRLARITPADSSIWQALWFGWRTNFLYSLLGFAPFMLLPLFGVFGASAVMPAPGGGPGAGAVASVIAGLAASLVGWAVIILLALGAWGLSAHAILRLTGQTRHPLGRTMQTLFYASGANIASGVPCIGTYAAPIGWGWSAVSGALMLRETQGVKGVRASFAAATGPAIAMIIIVGAVFAFVFGAMRMSTSVVRSMGPGALVDARETYFTTNGRWPAHPVELLGMGAGGGVAGFNFTAMRQGSVTDGSTLGAGGHNLQFGFPTAGAARTAAIAAAVAEIPTGATAHRVGDIVFLDVFSAGPPSGAVEPRWMMIVHADPASNPPPRTIEVFLSDGAALSLSAAEFPEALAAENAAREARGLVPVPDPATILGPAPVPVVPFTPGDPDAEYVDDSETGDAPPDAPPPATP